MGRRGRGLAKRKGHLQKVGVKGRVEGGGGRGRGGGPAAAAAAAAAAA